MSDRVELSVSCPKQDCFTNIKEVSSGMVEKIRVPKKTHWPLASNLTHFLQLASVQSWFCHQSLKMSEIFQVTSICTYFPVKCFLYTILVSFSKFTFTVQSCDCSTKLWHWMKIAGEIVQHCDNMIWNSCSLIPFLEK